MTPTEDAHKSISVETKSMSKSQHGTKKTSSSINQDSHKYVDRSDAPMGKKGSAAAHTDAAHKLSWGLVNAIQTHTPGRPLGAESRQDLGKAMNSEGNLRIKSAHGNRVLDERRDARIAHAYATDKPIEGKSTAARAVVAFNASKDVGLDSVTKALGNIQRRDGLTTFATTKKENS
jgi:hypothetical protein